MTLIICGAGQYGLVAKETAGEMKLFSRIEFLDDTSELAVGSISDIDRMEYDYAVVAIGNPTVRDKLLAQIPKSKTAILVHPRAVVSPSAEIGEGVIVEAGAVISTDAKIGRGTIVMANAVVGHNATVGACCQLKYNCTVPENCVVPPHTKVDCHVVYEDAASIEKRNK